MMFQIIHTHMKPFLLSILKCPKCNFSTKLRVGVTRASKVDVGKNSGFIKSRVAYFRENNCENLRNINNAFRQAAGDFYLLDENQIGQDDNAEDLNRFLLGNEIEEGCLICGGCKEEYCITDRIPRFLKK